ncbi:MAG: hypothetical protein GX455_17605 [Phycisphaerae bacterium]|nr:hypothetical protein [Phycisphaerae bacterium]
MERRMFLKGMGVVAAGLLAGCSKSEPAKKPGAGTTQKQVDDAAKKATDTAADATKKATDTAADATKKAADATKEAADAVKKAADKAAEAIPAK